MQFQRARMVVAGCFLPPRLSKSFDFSTKCERLPLSRAILKIRSFLRIHNTASDITLLQERSRRALRAAAAPDQRQNLVASDQGSL